MVCAYFVVRKEQTTNGSAEWWNKHGSFYDSYLGNFSELSFYLQLLRLNFSRIFGTYICRSLFTAERRRLWKTEVLGVKGRKKRKKVKQLRFRNSKKPFFVSFSFLTFFLRNFDETCNSSIS